MGWHSRSFPPHQHALSQKPDIQQLLIKCLGLGIHHLLPQTCHTQLPANSSPADSEPLHTLFPSPEKPFISGFTIRARFKAQDHLAGAP